MVSPPPPSSLAEALEAWVRHSVETTENSVSVLFVSGAQGAGKSTAVRHLAGLPDVSVACLGIDDFYLEKARRQALAAAIHPLFETRGPPGTHDLPLLHDTLTSLIDASERSHTQIPIFDKLWDDRAPREAWGGFSGRADVIVLEGWLMGVSADPAAAKAPPINTVERQDPDGLWRGHQEDCLLTEYNALWDRADGFFHIDAPGFDTVHGWRLQQEATTRGTTLSKLDPEVSSEIARFIQYYERLTRRLLAGQRRAGTVIKLDANRRLLPAS